MACNYMSTKFSVVWSKDNWKKNNKKSLLKITILNFPCGVYFYFITHSHILWIPT